MTFGDRVKKILVFKKITQRSFAKCIGVSKSELNNMLNNRKRPNAKEIEKAIEVLNVPYDCLMGKVPLFDEMLEMTSSTVTLW